MELDGKLKLVMMDIDSFPKLTQGLNIRSVPSVFLIYKGNIVDMFQGMPQEDQLDKFLQTGIIVSSLETDTNVMAEAMIQIEQLLKDKNFTKAEAAVDDALKLEEWVNNYGTELTLSKAYCLLFSDPTRVKDTIAIRELLGVLTEQKINDASDFYQ